MFKKILDFIKNLFNKKQEVEVKEEVVVATPSEPEKKEEEAVEEVAEAPVIEKQFIEFSEEDKSAIVDLLRPLVKEFNSDDAYAAACETIQSKLLKTYSSLSEDKKDLVIKLTQSDRFNNAIASFLADHVATAFKAAIDANELGKFEITAENGEIHIKKIA